MNQRQRFRLPLAKAFVGTGAVTIFVAAPVFFPVERDPSLPLPLGDRTTERAALAMEIDLRSTSSRAATRSEAELPQRTIHGETGYSYAELDFLSRAFALIDRDGAAGLETSLEDLLAAQDLARDTLAHDLVKEAIAADFETVVALLSQETMLTEQFPDLVATAARDASGRGVHRLADWIEQGGTDPGFLGQVLHGMATSEDVSVAEILQSVRLAEEVTRSDFSPALTSWVQYRVGTDPAQILDEIASHNPTGEITKVFALAYLSWEGIDPDGARHYATAATSNPPSESGLPPW